MFEHGYMYVRMCRSVHVLDGETYLYAHVYEHLYIYVDMGTLDTYVRLSEHLCKCMCTRTCTYTYM